MKYFVYVIKSSEGFIYKGMTDNLEIRLVEHNNKIFRSGRRGEQIGN